AEDGIRDFHVTGVQTCALPISGATTASSFTRWLQPLRISLRGRQGFCGKAERMTKQLLHLVMGGRVKDPQGVEFQDLNDIHVVRSEERRVGKECRARGVLGEG